MHAAPSKAHAQRAADRFNDHYCGSVGGVLCRAVVEPWPHSAESHAESVEKFCEEWLIPQQQARVTRTFFDPAQLTKDSYGWYIHPDAGMRIWFNGEPDNEAPLDPERFAELGLELAFVLAEDDPDFDGKAYYDGHNPYPKWEPKPPEGEGWRLGMSYDTEDGPAAFFVRDMAVADQLATPKLPTKAELKKVVQDAHDNCWDREDWVSAVTNDVAKLFGIPPMSADQLAGGGK